MKPVERVWERVAAVEAVKAPGAAPVAMTMKAPGVALVVAQVIFVARDQATIPRIVLPVPLHRGQR